MRRKFLSKIVKNLLRLDIVRIRVNIIKFKITYYKCSTIFIIYGIYRDRNSLMHAIYPSSSCECVCVCVFLFILHFNNALLAKSCLNKSWRWALVHVHILIHWAKFFFGIYFIFFSLNLSLSISPFSSLHVQLIFRSRCIIFEQRKETPWTLLFAYKIPILNVNVCDFTRLYV